MQSINHSGMVGQAPRGLTSQEAESRLALYGPNEINRGKRISPWVIFAGQFKSAVIWLLLGACAISGILGELTDAIAIGAIVIINAFIGFFQEYRAERAVLALRRMTSPRANVIRDDKRMMIPAANVVPGDLLLLEAGDIVAADARLREARQLAINEAPLSGESLPAEKSIVPTAPDVPLVDQKDHVFMGTSVVKGTGLAEVFATGVKTELSKIAELISTAEGSTAPMQGRLEKVSRILLFLCIGIVLLVSSVGLIRGHGLFEVFLSGVSLAVAAVPEGLPAIVTIALAIGVGRMAVQHVLVRRLPSVETLGCATVICTDKTGTLTTGVMTVRELWGADQNRVLEYGTSCSDAELNAGGLNGLGDPTEIAILVAAASRNIHRRDIERTNPQVTVNPFDSDRKLMSIKRADKILYVKGAPEKLFARCVSGLEGADRAHEQMVERGLRVLGVAAGEGEEENELRLIGLIGIADPPRTEAVDAISQARRAGIKTVMITGDHPLTARTIARELGILRPGDPEDLVHARATPEDKLKIVRELKARGEIVAMTGDGVNDAPALKEAHIGIAMGKTGTEVTREASDMVLTDDNFASIIAAVREGRGIFDNIRKTLVYLLGGNTGELLLMFAAAAFGLPFPLLPLHLLWVNLVTDGLPALALVTDPTDKNVLDRKPRNPSEPMLGRSEWGYIVMTGFLQASVTLGVFIWALRSKDLNEARNLAFSTLVFGEVLRSFASRSPTRLFWEVGAFTNMRLLTVVVVSVIVQLAIHHMPLTQKLFQIHDISLGDCLFSLGLGFIPVTVLEGVKLIRRWVKVA